MEPKPAQQYEATAVPLIDEESKRLAMAKALVEQEKQRRVMACSAEINKAIGEILARHNCTLRPTFQIIAQDEQATG